MCPRSGETLRSRQADMDRVRWPWLATCLWLDRTIRTKEPLSSPTSCELLNLGFDLFHELEDFVFFGEDVGDKFLRRTVVERFSTIWILRVQVVDRPVKRIPRGLFFGLTFTLGSDFRFDARELVVELGSLCLWRFLELILNRCFVTRQLPDTFTGCRRRLPVRRRSG